MVEEKVNVLIITEDTGKGSFELFRNLINSILREIITDFQSQLIEYVRIDARHSEVLSGNSWMQKRPRNKKLRDSIYRLKREIIQYLLGKQAFVFWHIDGDMKWCEFTKKGSCLNLEKLNDFLAPITAELDTHRNNKAPNLPKDKILKLLPFYSVEAWLYQNSAALQKINEDTSDIKNRAPQELDEILMVKEFFKIKAKYNLELSKQFPYQKVYALGKSFHHTVEELKRGCGFIKAIEKKQVEYLQQWN